MNEIISEMSNKFHDTFSKIKFFKENCEILQDEIDMIDQELK